MLIISFQFEQEEWITFRNFFIRFIIGMIVASAVACQ